jgi:hypothetical protein
VLGWDPKRDDVASVLLLDQATTRDMLAAALACQKLRVDESKSRSRAYAYADERVADFEAAMIRSGWRVDYVQTGVAPRFAVSVDES